MIELRRDPKGDKMFGDRKLDIFKEIASNLRPTSRTDNIIVGE